MLQLTILAVEEDLESPEKENRIQTRFVSK